MGNMGRRLPWIIVVGMLVYYGLVTAFLPERAILVWILWEAGLLFG